MVYVQNPRQSTKLHSPLPTHTQKCQTPPRNSLEPMSEFGKVTVCKPRDTMSSQKINCISTRYQLTCVSKNLQLHNCTKKLNNMNLTSRVNRIDMLQNADERHQGSK